MSELTQKDFIDIKGAREHNLKGIDVKIPRNKMVVLTGLSGSGKSDAPYDAYDVRMILKKFKMINELVKDILFSTFRL